MVRVALIFLMMLELGGCPVAEALDAEGLKSGVVKITATEGQKKKVGTGFIVKADSDVVHIVTAAHVIAGDSQPKVQFFTQQDVQIQTTVKHAEGSDDPTALALLVLRGKGNIPAGLTTMSLATATRVTSGDDIMVIGHPRGAGDWAIIKGSIASREGRDLKVDANIDEGNSGGPIIHNGQVVGLIGGAHRYGKGVTIGTVREYLEGHGVVPEERSPSSVAKAPPPSSQATQPMSSPAREITGKDDAPMVLVPAGEFWMGSPDNEGAGNEHPRHLVALSAFSLDKYEVTNRRFEQFVRETSYNWRKPKGAETAFSSKRDDHPVVFVSWDDAQAYCRWVGKRLPTEAESEYATRAGTETKYWWGNERPGSRRVANIADESFRKKDGAKYGFLNNNIMFGYDDGYIETAPVGSFEANQFGLHDMIGNVMEWTSDWYEGTYNYQSLSRNPTGSSNGQYRVLRGGSWNSGPYGVGSAIRHAAEPTRSDSETGFRCAKDAK